MQVQFTFNRKGLLIFSLWDRVWNHFQLLHEIILQSRNSFYEFCITFKTRQLEIILWTYRNMIDMETLRFSQRLIIEVQLIYDYLILNLIIKLGTFHLYFKITFLKIFLDVAIPIEISQAWLSKWVNPPSSESDDPPTSGFNNINFPIKFYCSKNFARIFWLMSGF